MAAHLKTCAQLDRSIRQESQTRTIFDPEVRRLRAALRAEGEAALLADYRTSLVCAVIPVLPAQFWCPPVRLRSRCPACPMPHCVKLQLAGAAACRSHSPPLTAACFVGAACRRSTTWSSCCGRPCSTDPSRSSGGQCPVPCPGLSTPLVGGEQQVMRG